MKWILLLSFFFTKIFSYSQTTLIPDPYFEQALINLGLDSGPIDGLIPTSNISTLSSLNVSYGNISDLTGIEDFISLTVLKVGHNQLSSINVTQNTLLTEFECHFNQISTIDVSQNTNLTYLVVGENNLTSLDVSQNTSLVELWCWANQITFLDVTNNPSLKLLYCYTNQIPNLDFSNNPLLEHVICTDNNIVSVNLQNCPNLLRFWGGNNQLSNLDLSQNPLLEYLRCNHNLLTVLDVSYLPNLKQIRCNNNQISELNFSNNPDINEVWADTNHLDCFNMHNGANWKIQNAISFQVEGNPNLTCIEVDNVSYSNNVWTLIDPQISYSLDCDNYCSTASILELGNQNRILVKIIDYLGREVSETTNSPVIYIYDDGSTQQYINTNY